MTRRPKLWLAAHARPSRLALLPPGYHRGLPGAEQDDRRGWRRSRSGRDDGAAHDGDRAGAAGAFPRPPPGGRSVPPPLLLPPPAAMIVVAR